MLATAGPPPDRPDQWGIEMKWDGMRAICRTASGRTQIFSRARRDVTRCFPEVAEALTNLAHGRDLIMDAEIVAPDAASGGAPSFALLQRRMYLTRPSAADIRSTPLQLIAFDLLSLGNENVMPEPYELRRERLTALDLASSHIQTPPHWLLPAQTMLDTASTYGPRRSSQQTLSIPLSRWNTITTMDKNGHQGQH